MDAAMSCLAPPCALTFADAAMARALHLSTMSSDSSSSSSLSLHAHYSPLLADIPAATYAAPTCDSVLVADSPPPTGRRGHNKQQQQQLGPAGARTGKRRSRASKRAPTTYISTDPTNFRIMVQQVTGAHADETPSDDMLRMLYAAAGGETNPLLPGPGADQASSSAAAHQQNQQQQLQQPCLFPTLDSWNVMYESTTTHLL